MVFARAWSLSPRVTSAKKEGRRALGPAALSERAILRLKPFFEAFVVNLEDEQHR